MFFAILLGCKKNEPTPIYVNTTVKGFVFEQNTNKPLYGIDVEITKENNIDKQDFTIVISTTSDSSGKYYLFKSIKVDNNYKFEVGAGPDAHHGVAGQTIILGDTNNIDLYLPKN